jgi:hypothetical protein
MPRNLRATACKFSVQPTQKRIWKSMFDKNCVPALAHGDTGTGEEKSKRLKKNSRFSGGGRKCALCKETVDRLEAFYDGKRNADLGVSLRLMTAECRLVDPSVLSLSPMALDGRIYRLLMKWDASWRRGTHNAQKYLS